jgi:hypothetical protein
MDTKLTLKMDRGVVRRIKTYASRSRRSISGIAEDYFRRLTEQEPGAGLQLSGTVAELAGVLRRGRSADARGAYRRHLEEKYR